MGLTPYAEGRDWTLYHGDCLEILPRLGPVDAVVTDPPFGIGFKYASHDDTPNGYGDFVWPRIEAAEMRCSPGSPVFVWQAMPNARRFAEWFPRDWRIFAACKNFVQIRPTAMNYAYDPVLVWWVGGNRYSRGDATKDWHIADTSPAARALDDIVSGHPCPRPLSQVRHIIDQWVRPDDAVLDPFTGSGTTGVACLKTGRKFIGIEIDEGYCEIAARRLRRAEEDTALFAEHANQTENQLCLDG